MRLLVVRTVQEAGFAEERVVLGLVFHEEQIRLFILFCVPDRALRRVENVLELALTLSSLLLKLLSHLRLQSLERFNISHGPRGVASGEDTNDFIKLIDSKKRGLVSLLLNLAAKLAKLGCTAGVNQTLARQSDRVILSQGQANNFLFRLLRKSQDLRRHEALDSGGFVCVFDYSEPKLSLCSIAKCVDCT